MFVTNIQHLNMLLLQKVVDYNIRYQLCDVFMNGNKQYKCFCGSKWQYDLLEHCL